MVDLHLCKKYTLTPWSHIKWLRNLITDFNNKNINGSVVECGVWKGGCMMTMIMQQKKFNQNREFYLYDTFDGMTAPSEKDGIDANIIYNEIIDGKRYPEHSEPNTNKWCLAPLEDVKKNINLCKYDKKKIHYIIGDVCETLKNNIPKNIVILRLDTDFYDSTKIELEKLYPNVISGGIIIIDDYYSWKGSKTATDEFIKKYKNEIKMIDKNLTGGRFCFIKN